MLKNNEYDDKTKDAQLSSKWNMHFKDAMVSKSDYTKRWRTYFDAYNGDYFKNDNLPDYRSDMVSNYIFSVIETVRPIMLDNDPKFQAMPRQPEGMALSNDLQEALMYEWDREKMNTKLYSELINTLVVGTSIFFLPWNSDKKNVKATAVNPFNLFPDPLATSIEDSEYLIYASYHNVEALRKIYPEKVLSSHGSRVNYSELVYSNDKGSRVDNQVLVLEIWTRDYESEELDNNGDTEVKKIKQKYPNGRVITLCPDLGIVLDDKKNPYKDGRFPFVMIKDYDIPGKFWGEGEVTQLISPQKYMNELNNAIIDNAKATANMPWIIDNNAGIKQGSITARPGAIIRKNPGTEVRRDNPPSMPMYVPNTVETMKGDIEMISGIHNTLRGENSSGVYTAQGILALQEAGQVRIRLKVKLLEEALASIAELWLSRMKQFWKDDRWLLISKIDGSYDMKRFTSQVLDYDYDIRITAGSTMPVNRGAMLDLMIRLAQTQMPDGQPLVDREAVVQYLPEEIKSSLMERMAENKSSLTAITQSIEELGQGLEQVGKGLEELGQGVQQVAGESDKADDEQLSMIEQLMGAVEQLNEQMLQLSGKHDSMVEDGKQKEQTKAMQDDFYNKGYVDAEKLYSQPDSITEGSMEQAAGMGLPDELLGGIESMGDDELGLLLEQNPNLMDLIK